MSYLPRDAITAESAKRNYYRILAGNYDKIENCVQIRMRLENLASRHLKVSEKILCGRDIVKKLKYSREQRGRLNVSDEFDFQELKNCFLNTYDHRSWCKLDYYRIDKFLYSVKCGFGTGTLYSGTGKLHVMCCSEFLIYVLPDDYFGSGGQRKKNYFSEEMVRHAHKFVVNGEVTIDALHYFIYSKYKNVMLILPILKDVKVEGEPSPPVIDLDSNHLIQTNRTIPHLTWKFNTTSMCRYIDASSSSYRRRPVESGSRHSDATNSSFVQRPIESGRRSIDASSRTNSSVFRRRQMESEYTDAGRSSNSAADRMLSAVSLPSCRRFTTTEDMFPTCSFLTTTTAAASTASTVAYEMQTALTSCRFPTTGSSTTDEIQSPPSCQYLATSTIVSTTSASSATEPLQSLPSSQYQTTTVAEERRTPMPATPLSYYTSTGDRAPIQLSGQQFLSPINLAVPVQTPLTVPLESFHLETPMPCPPIDSHIVPEVQQPLRTPMTCPQINSHIPEVQQPLRTPMPCPPINSHIVPEVQQPLRTPKVQQPLRTPIPCPPIDSYVVPEVQQPLRTPMPCPPIDSHIVPEVQQPLRTPMPCPPINSHVVPEVQQPLRTPMPVTPLLYYAWSGDRASIQLTVPQFLSPVNFSLTMQTPLTVPPEPFHLETPMPCPPIDGHIVPEV